MLHIFYKTNKLIPTLIILLLFGTFFIPCVASIQAAGIDSPPSITVNGQLIHSDVEPVMENDRILIPARAVSEALGAVVEWEPSGQKITVKRGETLVTLWIGNTRALKGDNELILDAAPRIVNGRTLVPLRFVSEALGALVEWRPDSREAIITLVPEETPQDTVNNQPDISTTPDSYDQPGTYGPDTGQQEVTGDVNINANNVTLQNQVINGDLTIGGTAPGAVSPISAAASGPAWLPVPGSGSGTVNVDNVNVRGTVYINGGSATHIVLNDFTCNELCVNDPSGIVQIDISGNSTVPLARLQSGAVLEEKELIGGGSGFKEIMITAPSGAQIKLSGLLSQVVCNGPGVKIQLLAGNVKELIIESAAAGSSVNIGGSSSVGRCTVNGSAILAGTGRVEIIEVYAEGTVRYMSLQVGSTSSGSGLQTVSDLEKVLWTRKTASIWNIDTGESPPPSVTITTAGGEDQVAFDSGLQLFSANEDTVWTISNFEGGGASLSIVTGSTITVLGPADPAGSGAGSSGRCVITATAGGVSVQKTIYIQGNGSQSYPFILRDGAGLTAMRNNGDPGNVNTDSQGHDLSAYDTQDFYKMVADVSLAAYQPWTPINMTDNFPSGGTVDGNEYLRFNGFGHHITGLVLNGDAAQGFYSDIGAISGRYDLKNLVLDAPSVTATLGQAGPLASSVGGARLSGIAVIGGSVSARSNTGGLVGRASDLVLSNCYSSSIVNGDDYVGGLVGQVVGTLTMSNCYASGAVSGQDYTGGLVGQIIQSTINNCWASGNVSGDYYVGGLAGWSQDTPVSNCYARGSVTAASTAGGLMGRSQFSQIINCAALGPSVTCTAVSRHRICGSYTAAPITNTYALSTMTVNGAPKAPGGLEGADVTPATALTAAFYTGTLGWTSPPWDFADGSYPALQNMP